MYLYYYDIVYPPPTPQAWRDMLPPLDALAKTLKVLSPMCLSCYRGGCLLYPVRSCFGETEGSWSGFKVCIIFHQPLSLYLHSLCWNLLTLPSLSPSDLSTNHTMRPLYALPPRPPNMLPCPNYPPVDCRWFPSWLLAFKMRSRSIRIVAPPIGRETGDRKRICTLYREHQVEVESKVTWRWAFSLSLFPLRLHVFGGALPHFSQPLLAWNLRPDIDNRRSNPYFEETQPNEFRWTVTSVLPLPTFWPIISNTLIL